MMVMAAGLPPVWADGESYDVSIVYSGNLDGELEPCGCSAEGDLGGIRRQATLVQQLRAENPDLFVISSGGFLSSESANDRLKSEYILKGIATLGYDAIGVQWSDLSYGPEFLETTPLPWTASNWIAKDDIQSQRSITR